MKRLAVVIDDDADFRDILERTLEADFEVRAVKDGPEGLRACWSEAPSVVLVDMQLPGMGGLEVLRALGGDPRSRGVPIVAFSAARFDSPERGTVLGRPGVRALLDKIDGPRAFLAAARAAAG